MLIDSGLENKTVIVTGGARGIGAAMVKSFAAHGAEVHFFYHQSKQSAQAAVEAAEALQQRVHAHCVDVRDKASVTAAIEKIVEKTEQIHVLVNNSGIVRDGLLVGLSDEDISDVLDTNLLGIFHTTQAVVPFMMQARGGKIINISSVSGEKAGRGQANYAASKGAVNAFTKAMAVELAKRNITVNAIAPGVINTEMSSNVRDMGSEETLSKILLNRYGSPEEVAHLATFLASRYAAYITGEIIHLDGGFKMA